MMGSLAFRAVLLPFAGALVVGLVGTPLQGAVISLGVVAITFGLTVIAPFGPGFGLLHADALGLGFGMLTGFIALTSAVQHLRFARDGTVRMGRWRWRAGHALGLVGLGAVLLGLYADDIGLLWLAVEIGTVAGALGVALPRTPGALRAAWAGFILGGVGSACALFGTMLVYLAAQPALGPGGAAMSFAALGAHGVALDGRVMMPAFVVIAFGYGAKAVLVPAAPAPLTIMPGLAANVALIAILRFQHLVAHPGPLLLTLGLASLALPAVALARQRDAWRFLTLSGIAQSGLVVFAFGIGGAAAIFGGLLHMALRSLIISAAQQGLIRASTLRGGFAVIRLRGLRATNARLGWLLGAALFALSGLPPSGLFASIFIIISQTVRGAPWLSAPLGLCLALCALAMLRGVGPLLFGPAPKARAASAGWDMGLSVLHLVVAFGLAFMMPPALVALLSRAAAALS